MKDPLDQPISRERAAQLPPLSREMLTRYCYPDNYGDLLLCWDHARYVNHSCRASCLGPSWDFELAVRDLAPGDELTDDYAMFCLDEPLQCACRAPDCRGTILPDDVLRYGDEWDRTIRDVLFASPNVDQPLWSLVAEKEEIALALAGKAPIPSCRGLVRDEFITRWHARQRGRQAQAAM